MVSLIFLVLSCSCDTQVPEPHERAAHLVGTLFRPQGRDPATGLDCLGLVICAFQLPFTEVPTYRSTDGCWPSVEREVARWFKSVGQSALKNNDLAVFQLTRSFHFGVISGAYLIHADASLGKVAARRLPSRYGRECRIYRLSEAS